MIAINLMAASRKGVSAHQLHRVLKITHKSAGFLEHHLREAMSLPSSDPIGGEGSILEADEAYLGRKKALPQPPSDPTPRPPWRTLMSMNRVESVARDSAGGLVISGREIAVEIPKSEISALLAGSRWPVDVRPPRSNADEPPPSVQMSLF